MVPKSVRNPLELRKAREYLGLSAEALARMLAISDGRTIRRWEAGDRELPGWVTVMTETALSYLGKIELITQQLNALQSGKMRTGTTEITGSVDDTKQTIVRLIEAKKSYEDAYELLTRQPLPGASSKEVHWYHLRRMTPEFAPGGRDDWSLPGELSPTAALAYFEKHEGFSEGLELCDDSDFSADFILEQRTIVRKQYGSATQSLSAGELVRTFFIRHRREVHLSW